MARKPMAAQLDAKITAKITTLACHITPALSGDAALRSVLADGQIIG